MDKKHIAMIIIIVILSIGLLNLYSENKSYKFFVEEDKEQVVKVFNDIYINIIDAINKKDINALIDVHHELGKYILKTKVKYQVLNDKYSEGLQELSDKFRYLEGDGYREYYESLLGNEITENNQKILENHKIFYKKIIGEFIDLIEE